MSVLQGNDALIIACKNNDIDKALLLIESGKCDIGEIDEDGNTALIYACKHKMFDVVIKLAETGKSNPGHPDADGNTALILVCSDAHDEVYRKLCDSGKLYPDDLDIDEMFGIYSKEVLTAVIKLIDLGDSNPGKVTEHGTTALSAACDSELSDVALKIIETDYPNIGSGICYSKTLFSAITHGLDEVALKFIEICDLSFKHNFMNDELLSHSRSLLIEACKYDMDEVAIKIIESGYSNPGYANEDGETALIIACQRLKPNVALKIIETGESNPGVTEILNNDTALGIACRNRMFEVAVVLIKTCDVDLNNINRCGETYLSLATRFKEGKDVALMLLEMGISNLGVFTKNSCTPLFRACMNNMPEVALKLIATGESNPGYISEDSGDTALIYACINNMPGVALKLIETGESNPGHINKSGVTALILACKNNMDAVASALIET